MTINFTQICCLILEMLILITIKMKQAQNIFWRQKNCTWSTILRTL